MADDCYSVCFIHIFDIFIIMDFLMILWFATTVYTLKLQQVAENFYHQLCFETIKWRKNIQTCWLALSFDFGECIQHSKNFKTLLLWLT